MLRTRNRRARALIVAPLVTLSIAALGTGAARAGIVPLPIHRSASPAATTATTATETSTLWDEEALVAALRTQHAQDAVRAAAREARHALWLAPPKAVAHLGGVDWLAIARCESNDRWHIATGNGYYGGLQFSEQTWLGAGGGKYAARPDLAFPAEQIRIASKLSLSAWPVCGSNG